MPDFLAIKKLGNTDLGWFRSLYHRYSNSNLKGINLNASVLIDKFYRDLAAIAMVTGNRVPVTVTMFGPAGAPAYPGTYKLVKSTGSKNWRLNGTLVSDPLDEDRRFNILAPNDIAVIAFDGRPCPTHINLVLIAAADADDAALHAALFPKFGGERQTMVALDPEKAAAIAQMPGVRADHPFSLLLDDPDAEAALADAVQGGIDGIRRLGRRRGMRHVTPDDVRRASAEMSRIGTEGEALVNGYLEEVGVGAGTSQYEWSSAFDAFAPYDFRCVSDAGKVLLIDVKTTKQGADEGFHMSLAEVICAAESEAAYKIYRLHGLTDAGACDSAWKKDPCGGVIGVQKGPLC